jgi:hypothetical protein
MPTSRAVGLALKCTEAEWQTTVIEYAQLRGWRVAHFRPARTEQGYRTAVQADGAGYPDLTLVRGGTLVFAELKSERGKLTAAQRDWLEELGRCSSPSNTVEVYTWRPSDWPEVQAVLS